MIIQCINCSKKFEVNSALVPENGRNIQCGLCNHTWFYNPTINSAPQILNEVGTIEQIQEIKITEEEKDISEKIQETKVIKKKKKLKKNQNQHKPKDDVLASEKTSKEIKDVVNSVKGKEASIKFNLIKILSYFIVGIISFIGIIIFLDTFKSPLSSIFPNIELLLYNLFESIKDIFLFIEDLFV